MTDQDDTKIQCSGLAKRESNPAAKARLAAIARVLSTEGLYTVTGGRSKSAQRGRLNWRHPLAVPAVLMVALMIPVFVAWKLITSSRAVVRWFRA
jgi:hypothetical protein